ncbi:MAG: ribosome assembly cofactor RimP [Bacteroides sp.]|nr:ribosome assembly cofactor RimP [Ruminococcus flavefaciens]MCM1554012.1 ribosome assembly cofactor RimP [Bacteroides sp.]
MINKKQIEELLSQALETIPQEEMFAVSVSVSPKNEIKVYIDSMKGVNIDRCVEVSRFIEQHLDRDAEDFELTVSSAGLDQPFRVPAQYVKNIGREVKTLTADGQNIKGVITAADENGFRIQENPTKKMPDAPEHAFGYAQVKETKIVISFK